MFWRDDLYGYRLHFRALYRAAKHSDRDLAVLCKVELAKGLQSCHRHAEARRALAGVDRTIAAFDPQVQAVYYNCVASIDYDLGYIARSLRAVELADEKLTASRRNGENKTLLGYCGINGWRKSILLSALAAGDAGLRAADTCLKVGVELQNGHIAGLAHLCKGFYYLSRNNHKHALEWFLRGLYADQYLTTALPKYITGELLDGVALTLGEYWIKNHRPLTRAINPVFVASIARAGHFNQVKKQIVPIAPRIDLLSGRFEFDYPPCHSSLPTLQAGATCHICGKLCENQQADHIFPKSRGGTNAPRNIAAACAECNRRKGYGFRHTSSATFLRIAGL